MCIYARATTHCVQQQQQQEQREQRFCLSFSFDTSDRARSFLMKQYIYRASASGNSSAPFFLQPILFMLPSAALLIYSDLLSTFERFACDASVRETVRLLVCSVTLRFDFLFDFVMYISHSSYLARITYTERKKE